MVTESMPPDSTIMESLFMGISHCEWECRESACFNEVLVVAVAAVGKGNDGDSAAGHELATHFDVSWLHKPCEVFHYYVHAVFVEVAVVAEAEQIQFQAFAFHHFAVGDVVYYYAAEVGLACLGAQAGEFGAYKSYYIVVFGVLVVESFEHSGVVVGRIGYSCLA